MASEVKEESNSTASDIKNDGDTDEKAESKSIDNSIKDDKDSVKNEAKEESGKEGSEDEDEEEEVALLDRPVEVTGCRARKKVERLEVSFSTPKEKQEFREGKGKRLGDCPRIEAQIQKIKVPDLKPLHKILFNRTGSANEIKKNIRKFSGFPFEKDSSEFNRKKGSVEKLTASVLKKVCEILDIERGGTKEEIVNRIMNFLLNPEDSGKKLKEAKSKKRVSKDKKKGASKKVKGEKKAKTEKDEDSDENESGGDVEEEEEEDDSDDEASMGGSDEENEEASSLSDEPKKKSKESKTSKPKAKAEKGRKDEKKTKASKRKVDDDSSESSGEEQQPAKKAKMPSDEEISKLVKDILESADLQEITMKKVIKQVSDAFPDFDLTHKKAFIKSTIKSVIS